MVYTLVYDKPSFPGSIAIVKSEPEKISSEGITTQVFFRGDKINFARAYGTKPAKS